jgi:hypothetical protein
MRHAREFSNYHMTHREVGESCVLEVLATGEDSREPKPLPPACADALAVLPEVGATNSMWKRLYMESTGQSESTFNRARRVLEDRELVGRTNRTYHRRVMATQPAVTTVTLLRSDRMAPTDAERERADRTPAIAAV